MNNTTSKKHWVFIVVAGCLLLIMSGCLSSIANDIVLQAYVTGTVLYTPIVSVSGGTALPTKAKLITLDELVANPATYLGEFIEVHGYNAGFYPKADCSPYVGPPTEWTIVAAPTTYKDFIAIDHPSFIQIKNTFGGMVSTTLDKYGYTIRYTIMKRVAIWGWIRLYEGGVGCQFSNGKGTPIPMEVKKVWYIDAVQLQYLESIEVNRPTK